MHQLPYFPVKLHQIIISNYNFPTDCNNFKLDASPPFHDYTFGTAIAKQTLWQEAIKIPVSKWNACTV